MHLKEGKINAAQTVHMTSSVAVILRCASKRFCHRALQQTCVTDHPSTGNNDRKCVCHLVHECNESDDNRLVKCKQPKHSVALFILRPAFTVICSVEHCFSLLPSDKSFVFAHDAYEK